MERKPLPAIFRSQPAYMFWVFIVAILLISSGLVLIWKQIRENSLRDRPY